ncbi:hypothetical protein RYB01_14090 [Pseudomonas syringae]|nr:hypothetical protein [Pseudomonas syringae]
MTAESIRERKFVQTLLDIAKFPERHRAVAMTWADHFDVPSELRDQFMLHYLTHTSSTRCWCVALHNDESVTRPTVARVGRQLQYFDGHLISAVRVDEKIKVPVHAPTTSRALKLAHKMITHDGADALLTSFCKHARDLARNESVLSIKPLVKYNSGVLNSEGRNNRFYAPRNRFYITCIGATLKRFCQSLDQELLHAVRSVQCPSAKLYNWLAQGDRKRRLQALKAQPVLVPVLVVSHGVSWPTDPEHRVPVPSPWVSLQEFCVCCEGEYPLDADTLLGRAVDTGLPLNSVLAWLFSAPKSAITFLGQQRVYDTGSALSRLNAEGLDSGWNALIAGAQLGNRRPTNKTEWRAFYSFQSSIPWQVLVSLGDMNNFMKGCPTDWADTAWPEIAAKLVDIRELFNNLDRVGNRQTVGTRKRLRKFIGLLTYRQLSNFVDAFHDAHADIRTRLEREIPPNPSDSLTRWPGFLHDQGPITCAATGLKIVELLCPDDLDREHSSMGHCIDTYDYRAYSGDCRLLSIRSDDHPVASIEITLMLSRNEAATAQYTLKHLRLAQIRGSSNQTPAPNSASMKAVEWFLASVRSGRIATNLDWPNLAKKLDRYADKASIYNIRFGEEVVGWAERYMGRRL